MNKFNKAFFILVIIISQISLSQAFNVNCFKEYSSFNANDKKTVKVQVNSSDSNIFFMQNDKLLPYKFYSTSNDQSIDYSIKEVSSWDKTEAKYINDNNYSTSFSFADGSDEKYIIIDLWDYIKSNSAYFRFNISHIWETKYYISWDWNKFDLVNESNISQFWFRYIKITFNNFPRDKSIQKTAIYDIIINTNPSTIYLVNPDSSWQVSVYNKYDCEFDTLKETLVKYWEESIKANYSIDKTSSEFNQVFRINQQYNSDYDNDWIKNDIDNCKYASNKDQKDSDKDLIWDVCDYNNKMKNANDWDIDKDWVSDSIDNCKYIYNPDQRDSNWDAIWDVCADDDNDWIIGRYDNCINIANQDQRDINTNNIGDACEFDKDSDGIYDSVDNCITTGNKDQKDIDSDGIWDACDNCKLFNPDQRDEDKNGSWDVCEDEAKYKVEHDKDRDSILDSTDNCPNVPNLDQRDLDNDSIGDSCDNCLSIQNPNQRDEDKNWVWDICEDADKDGMDWYKDNCPFITNIDQKDSNNNWVWNVCEDDDGDWIINSKDNCPNNYNADQIDVDNDNKWDACDTKDDRYIESNRSVFIGLMALIIAFFGIGIYSMVKKLNKK